MAGTVQRAARRIDDLTRSVWDSQGTVIRILILVVLVLSGVGIPLILVALVARAIATDRGGRGRTTR